jgi:hypothetical protein
MLALFLSYRLMGPSYERKETLSLASMGTLHTELSAERLSSKLSVFREQLKENALRLVDSTRGPVFLDPAQWLWLRVQDRDWRATNYLEAFPAPKAKVDTWVLSSAKNSFVISERVPIVKDGVLDFVLVEGGLKADVFNDIQKDGRFGIWLFDREAYKESGLSASKLMDRPGLEGALGQNEVALLTSEMLTQIFSAQEPISIQADKSWVLYFKNAGSNSQLGVLGFWPAEVPPADLTSTWFSLAALMLAMALVVSLLLQKLAYREIIIDEAPSLGATAVGLSRSTVQDSKLDSLVQEQLSTKLMNDAKASKTQSLLLRQVLTSVFKSLYQELSPTHIGLNKKIQSLFIQEDLSSDALLEELKALSVSSTELEFTLKKVKALASDEGKAKSVDLELMYRESQIQNPDFSRMESFFDKNIWRVYGEPDSFEYLMSLCVRFIKSLTPAQLLPRLSVRLIDSLGEDSGLVELVDSPAFKAPYLRLAFDLETQAPLSRNVIHEFFDPAYIKADHCLSYEMPLSLALIDRLGGRLKMKSNFEDGHVLYLDIPAYEERRAEDQVIAEDLKTFAVAAPTIEIPVVETPPAETTLEVPLEGESTVLASEIPIPEEDILPELDPSSEAESESEDEDEDEGAHWSFADAPDVEDERTMMQDSNVEEVASEAPAPTLSLAEIEKARSFAENITDERSRVRSRFRIRKPGEKQ